MIGIQYQLDQDPTGTPLHEWVDNVTLTMWYGERWVVIDHQDVCTSLGAGDGHLLINLYRKALRPPEMLLDLHQFANALIEIR
jgi:hypothetical protein